MTDIVVKIMLEVLSVLALATEQIKQGRFSKYTITIYNSHRSKCHREVREKAIRGGRCRGSTREVRPIDSG